MIAYYVVRDVVRGSNCSYPYGRTLCREVFKHLEQARSYVNIANASCNVPGVCYLVLPHEETQPVDADHYENGGRVIRLFVAPTPDGRFVVASESSGGVLSEDGRFCSKSPLKYFSSVSDAKGYVQSLTQEFRQYVFTDPA